MNKWIGGALIFGYFLDFASASQKYEDPVKNFTLNIDYCAYTASPPGMENQQFIDGYEVALNLAIGAMREREPKITYTQAIFSLRSICRETLSNPMLARP